MKTALRLSAMAIAALIASVLNAATLRVVSKAADKTGDWADAYLSISEAIAAAQANDTILVASGRYVLSETLTISTAHLTIRSASLTTGEEDREGTVIDGGWDEENDATGVRLFQVNAQNFTLDGFTLTHANCDGKGAVINLKTGNGARYYSVTNCVFTGNRSTAEGTCIYSYTINDGTIADCVFTNNVLTNATGIAYGCAIFTQHNSYDADDRIRVLGCTFGYNSVAGLNIYGGTVYAGKSIALDGCKFLGSDKLYRFGTSGSNYGLQVFVNKNSEIRNCLFTGVATSSIGSYKYGTLLCINGVDVVLSNCTFGSISETSNGFGVICIADHRTTLVDCTFTNNTLKSNLMFSNVRNGHVLRNCLFADNANSSSRILHNFKSTGLVYDVENCTFANNTGSIFGNQDNTGCTNLFVNSILTTDVEASSGDKVLIVSNCCVKTLPGGAFDSGNFVSDAPGFKNAAKGNYRLLSTSPCIDAGIRLDWMDGDSQDLSGFPRVAGSNVDIGCYERQDGEMDTTLLVVASESDKTGEWADASTDVQGVIDSAVDGDLILVRSGVYSLASELVISNKTVTFKSRNPSTGEPDRAGTVFDGALCDGRAMVVSTGPEAVVSGYGPVPVASHPIVVEGFTFRNFTCTGDGGAVWFGGQGSSGGTPATIKDCVFYSNEATGRGGAMFMYHGGRVQDCVFEGNTAGGNGGAICQWYDTAYTWNVQDWPSIDLSVRGWYYPQIVSCTFGGNTGTVRGGAVSATHGMYVEDCGFYTNICVRGSGSSIGGGLQCSQRMRVLGCRFEGNDFSGPGGGVYGSALNAHGGTIVSNCVCTGNGEAFGAIRLADASENNLVVDCISTNNPGTDGFWVVDGVIRQCLSAGNNNGIRMHEMATKRPLRVENCTVVGNKAYGMSMTDATSKSNVVVNSIFVGNKLAPFNLATANGSQACAVSDTIVDSAKPANEYIMFTNVRKVSDMRFADAATGDYRLTARSPACEFGTMLSWMTAADVDMDGNPRIVSRAGLPLASDGAALPDAGCYEFQAAHPLPGLSIVIE